jgi:alkanesulfonate monooxygenase SsuD/methylene tetrahydromethanopterin reductase-like flavin-dependent oxidoreductase (luciferase family)
MTSPVLVAANEADGKAILDRLPPERRAHVAIGTPEQAAERLRPYIDAGFTGFTFNNPVLPNEEAIAAAGELLRLVS